LKESVSPVPGRKYFKEKKKKKDDNCTSFGSRNNAFQAPIIFLTLIPGGSFHHMIDYLLKPSKYPVRIFLLGLSSGSAYLPF